jgi:hypothetical protein
VVSAIADQKTHFKSKTRNILQLEYKLLTSFIVGLLDIILTKGKSLSEVQNV